MAPAPVVRWRERRGSRGGTGAGAGVGGGGGGGGGGGLFMMPSPINTAEVMTQIVFPLHGVTSIDSRPLPDVLGGGRGEHSALRSSSVALLTIR